jgi:hypothetical protein
MFFELLICGLTKGNITCFYTLCSNIISSETKNSKVDFKTKTTAKNVKMFWRKQMLLLLLLLLLLKRSV